MLATDVVDLFAYTEWANRLSLAAAEPLGSDAWSVDHGGGLRTLGDTLAHVVAAEWAWLQWWTGPGPSFSPDWLEKPTAAGLRGALDEVEAGRASFLAGLTPADLRRPQRYAFRGGPKGSAPLGDTLVHVVHHSGYHRGQVALMIRRLGGEPPATSPLIFAAEHRSVKESRVFDPRTAGIDG